MPKPGKLSPGPFVRIERGTVEFPAGWRPAAPPAVGTGAGNNTSTSQPSKMDHGSKYMELGAGNAGAEVGGMPVGTLLPLDAVSAEGDTGTDLPESEGVAVAAWLVNWYKERPVLWGHGEGRR